MSKITKDLGQINFLMVCRLLVDKGVREYVKAAQIVKQKHPEVRFRLAGPLDPNPSGLPRTEIEQWKNKGIVDYLGMLDDIRPAFKDCSVYVLPSYREGTPRTVLEAMSMGRPIITTNTPGCRETIQPSNGRSINKNSTDVIQGKNGFLIPTRNVEKLVYAMQQFIKHPELIKKMGQYSRKIAEEKYDVDKVNNVILRVMGLI